MDTYILVDKDNPVIEKDFYVWSHEICNMPPEWKVVSRTKLDDRTEVVTEYTGKTHRQQEPGKPPLLWETNMYEGDTCDFMGAYSTRRDAEAGHKKAVELIRYIRGEGVIALVTRERRNRSIFGRIRRKLTGIYKSH